MVHFALQRRLESPRVVGIVDYGPRWQMHVLRVQSEADLDEELNTWLQESHDMVGLQSDLWPESRPE
jgi:hypothetical protein